MAAACGSGLAQESQTTLQEVTVKASGETGSTAEKLPAVAPGGQVAKGARLGLLGNVDVMDAPFSVTAYTSETIQNQQAATVGDVLKNDPSVRTQTSDGHNAENFTIRGFEINSSELAFNGLYGLLPATHVSTDMLERVEVFRGPSALLSGIAPSGAIGGVINLVPKRAGDEPLTRLTTSWSTKSQFGLAADVSRRFGEENRLGIRVNGSYRNGETAVNDMKRRERLGSVALDYRGRGWKVSLDAYATSQAQAGSPVMVGFSTLGYVLKAPDASTNYLKGTYVNQLTKGAVVRGEYELNDQWTLYGALGGSRYDYDGVSVNGTRIVVRKSNGYYSGVTYGQAGYTHSVSGEVGLRGRLRTGSLNHQIVLSASLLEQRTGAAVVKSSSTAYSYLYNAGSLNVANAAGTVYKTGDKSYSSLGLADTVSFLDDKLQLLGGLRVQKVDTKSWSASTPTVLSSSYDKSALSPSVGVVFKPWDASTSLYANYIEGLTTGTTVGSAYKNAGEVLAPYQSKQYEAGVKWNAGHFTNTLALFQITKAGTLEVDNSDGTVSLTADGEQRHRGVEWTVSGEVARGVRALGGITYTRGELVKSTDNQGNEPEGVPKWTANLGAEWDLPWVPGLTVSGRIVYTSAQWLNSSNTIAIGGWTRFDAGASYATRLYGKNVVFRANVENIADRNYWAGYFNTGYATLGAPRTFKLSATVDF
ncbi:MAG: TonB-dependent siderophore receptor [Comamonas sp.]